MQCKRALGLKVSSALETTLAPWKYSRSEEHTSELQSQSNLVCRLLLEKKTYYDRHPDGKYAFKRCAAELFRLLDPNVRLIDFTRPWRDGDRYALDESSVGSAPSAITV